MQRLLIIIIIILSLLGSVTTLAQSSNIPFASPGDQFYRADQFTKARLWYSAAVARDSADWHSAFMLGESLRQLFRYSEALAWYRRVYERVPNRFPAAEFYYALMLKQQQRCPEALPRFEHFIRTHRDTHPLVGLAHIEQQGCYQMTLGAPDTSAIRLERLPSPLNTVAHDFAAMPYRHDSSLVLTSGRRHSPGRSIDYRFGENYTNLIVMERGEGQWKERKSDAARWNTPEHDGPGCFSADRMQFYFTRCQDDYCRIYVSERRKKKWSPPRALSEAVNAPHSNSKHPTLSARGDTLYFASDRAGGYGGTDLWWCLRDSSGWQAAQNLGESVNTLADEIAPFYYPPEDLFFFASPGLGGAGGMDLYGISRFVERPASWLPRLLLAPFNSRYDDIFLVVGHRAGFLASNRTGNFDVYRFAPDTLRTLAEQVFGASFSPSNQPPLSATLADKVLWYDGPIPSVSNDIMIVRSVPEERLANGSSRFILNSNVNDIALRQLRDQPTKSSSASSLPQPRSGSGLPPSADSTTLVSFSTDFIPAARWGEVTGSLYHQAGQQRIPTARAGVHLLNGTGEVVKITTTNEIGQFRFVNLNPQGNYAVALADRTARADTTLRVEDLVVREYGEDITTVPYETLYFDFNQPVLRPEAQQSLSDLADYFRQHPRTAIEINAFADSLGNDAYNLQLSQQRGESVFRYLLEQGVDPAALVINAQGISTSLSSTNSFVSQQLNRRVEIQLISRDVPYYPRAEIRILRPNVSANQLYQSVGLRYEELKQLNGWRSEQIVPLKPLRVPVLESPVLDQFFFDVNYQVKEESKP